MYILFLYYLFNSDILVGIVGWTMGGGRGWTAPLHGVGADQVLNMSLVLADGTITTANFDENKDLFNAIRGGGPGFGIITEITLKMHKVRIFSTFK